MAGETQDAIARPTAWRGSSRRDRGRVAVSHRFADGREHPARNDAGGGAAKRGAKFWKFAIYKGCELGRAWRRNHGSALAGRAIRSSAVGEKPWIRICGAALAGIGDWRQRGYFQFDQHDSAAAVAD